MLLSRGVASLWITAGEGVYAWEELLEFASPGAGCCTLTVVCDDSRGALESVGLGLLDRVRGGLLMPGPIDCVISLSKLSREVLICCLRGAVRRSSAANSNSSQLDRSTDTSGMGASPVLIGVISPSLVKVGAAVVFPVPVAVDDAPNIDLFPILHIALSMLSGHTVDFRLSESTNNFDDTHISVIGSDWRYAVIPTFS